jgi:hypothetical protein
MNYSASHWETADRADGRRQRLALDRLLDRAGSAPLGRAADILNRAGMANPAIAGQRQRIAIARTRLAQTAEAVAGGGALATVMLVAAAALFGPVAADLVEHLLAALMALAMFALVPKPGRPHIALQVLAQGVATLMLVAASHHLALDLGFALLGWLAIAARAVVALKTRGFDLDEMELVLSARGRDEQIAAMRLQRAAAI